MPRSATDTRLTMNAVPRITLVFYRTKGTFRAA